jgi:MFS family permease
LTDTFGWRSIFLVNVPAGLLAAPLARALVVESRGGRRALDARGGTRGTSARTTT